MRTRFVTFDDDGPDDLGRRRFTVDWIAVPFASEPDRCVARGQCFRANPEDFLKQSAVDGRAVVLGPMPPSLLDACTCPKHARGAA